MDLIATFQQLVAEVPTWVQPFILMLAGAVPFVEGEGGASIGIIGGINPVIAAVSAAVGNFLCVAILVWISAGARSYVVDRAGARSSGAITAAEPVSERKAARQAKFQRALSKYGVPGVSLLGPLLLPTQFTATMLAAVGVSRGRVLLWQGLAITLWTTVIAVMITQLLGVVAAV